MALPDEIAVRLSSQGIGSTTSTGTWRIFADAYPPNAGDRSVVITESGGFGPYDTAETGELFRPTFQVAVRGPKQSPTTARQKMDAVVSALHRYASTNLNGRKYVDVVLQGDVHYLGEDENRRALYAANFLALRSQTT